jgi:hypothetical protein
MKLTYLVASALHAAFALILVSMSNSPLLTLTARRQFDEWSSLLEAFRSAPSIADESLRERALHLAWCNVTLPPGTVRAPYCRCVERAHAEFRNATGVSLAQARDDAEMYLVRCLGDRAVWRVAPVWGVRFATPAVYVLFIASCFLWIAADVPLSYSDVPIFFFTFVAVVLAMVGDYIHNSFWAFTFVMVAVIIDLILLPGMAIPLEPPALQQMNVPVVLPSAALIKRTPSCFWWAEYLSAPVFALYVPLMHCGRDLFFVSVFTMIGTAVGGLGLRSFWCSQAYSEKPKEQFVAVMQYVVWLGIFAACVSLSFMTGVYYSYDVPYAMGPGSVALLTITFFISLMQWPGNQDFEAMLFVQMALALVRNVALFGVVLSDVLR